MPESIEQQVFELQGVVQGIGLRPALFRLAARHGLGGYAQNRSGVVRWCLQGPAETIAACVEALRNEFPAAGRLDSVTRATTGPCTRIEPFRIAESERDCLPVVQIPPDLRICPDCRRELFDPANRRYGYAFTTCTLCGPRYTVVQAMPYDRERTTLAAFPLCAQCRAEYRDPGNRRFHAESIACPDCGPRIWLERPGGVTIEGDVPALARAALARDQVVALRGIGGFLLAVDATSRAALTTLRTRKQRPHKPFAVMARNLDAVRALCDTTPTSEALLTSSAGPIVILPLKLRSARPGPVMALVSPDTDTLGVMLPTSPLHELLALPLHGDPTPPFDYLVMTSGNHRGEPIATTCGEARERLADIADLFLMHHREINLRNDDSVAVMRNDQPQLWRRARGYAPNPFYLSQPLQRTVLAMGAELKNAIAVGQHARVVLSPHVGDLDTPEAVAALQRVVHDLPRFLDAEPEAVAVDLHPDMPSTRLGSALATKRGLPLVHVQHHHAHAVACLAEHGTDAGLVLTFDGTGLGTDGTIWGAELLAVEPDGYRRLATFAPVPLPGGDAATRDARRQVAGRCYAYDIPYDPDWADTLNLPRDPFEQWCDQCARGFNAPLTHAAGRVFDGIAALLGIAQNPMTYDGQHAIRLERAALRCHETRLPELPVTTREHHGMLEVDWSRAFHEVVRSRSRLDPTTLALAAHHAVASAALRMVEYGLSHVPSQGVGLSGGVLMNRVLTETISRGLEARGIRPLLHRLSPPGDGCIALGQAIIAGRNPGN